MIIRGPRPESGYYNLDKLISEDERLSWGARGLLVFLLGKPDGWKVSVPALVNETQFAIGKQSRRDAVKAILDELGAAGYLNRADKPRQRPDGRVDGWDYFISEVPSIERTFRLKKLRSKSTSLQPHTDFPYTDEPHTAGPHTVEPDLVNNDFEVTNEVSSKPSPSPAAPAKKKAAAPAKTKAAPDPEGETYPAAFLEFWAVYPRKQGKREALAKWEDGLRFIGGRRPVAIAKILKAAEGFAEYVVQAKKEPKFVPMPARWLNEGRWDDEVPVIGPEDAAGHVWWTSYPGCELHGATLGIARKNSEDPATFRLRVLVAAGPGPWQDAELAKATRDNASGYVKRLKALFGHTDVALPAGVPRAVQSKKSRPPPGFYEAAKGLKSTTAR